MISLQKAVEEFQIDIEQAIEHLSRNGKKLEFVPGLKITNDQYKDLFQVFCTNISYRLKYKYTKDFSAFTPGEAYECTVVHQYLNYKDRKFLIVEYNGNYYSVPAHKPLLTFGRYDTVYCDLAVYKDTDTLYLKLTRFYVVSRLYKLRETYLFTVEEQDEVEGIWVVRDNHNLQHQYHLNKDNHFDSQIANAKVGDQVPLVVSKIKENGFLQLVSKIDPLSRTLFHVEDVFTQIGLPYGEKKFFFGFSAEDQRRKQAYHPSFLEQYAAGENLWFFSYLSFLDDKILQLLERKKSTDALEIIHLYQKLEDWLLHRSDFLENFSGSKKNDIVLKAEAQLTKLNEMEAALNLFNDTAVLAYLNQLKNKYESNSMLNEFEKGVLKGISEVSIYFPCAETEDLLQHLTLYLIRDKALTYHDAVEYLLALQQKINQLSDQLGETGDIEAESATHPLFNTIIARRYFLLSLYNFLENEQKSNYTAVQLLKYLSLYHKNPAYLHWAIHLLCSGDYVKVDLFRFLDPFSITADSIPSLLITTDSDALYHNGSGRLERVFGRFVVVPNNLHRGPLKNTPKTILQLKPFAVYMQSQVNHPVIDSDRSISELRKVIHEAMYFKRSDKEVLHGLAPDELYKGKIKSLKPGSHYVFLRFGTERGIIDTLLHINKLFPFLVVSDLDGILDKNDQIQFHIAEIKDQKVHISCSKLFASCADRQLKNTTCVYGKVIKKIDGNTYLLAHKGFIVRVAGEGFEINSIYSLMLSGYDAATMCFTANESSIVPANYDFTASDKTLLRNFLKKCGIIMPIEITEVSDRKIHNPQLRFVSHALINCLELHLPYLKNEKERLLHYFYLNRLASVCLSSKSYRFYDLLKNEMQATAETKSVE